MLAQPGLARLAPIVFLDSGPVPLIPDSRAPR
jgi:hypothetical protein